MRRAFSGLLLVFSFWVPAAWPKHQREQEPIFMAPDFRFSQIDTICVAPTIDLRPDTTQPLTLSGPRPPTPGGFRVVLAEILTGGTRVRHVTADEAVAQTFNAIGYKTVSCNPVNATLNDPNTPSDVWMRKLDFGGSRWLFILAVEYVSTPYSGGMVGLSNAVVSGYVFDKQADGGRPVWRDKVIGVDFVPDGIATFRGRKNAVTLIESERAIADGARRLLAKFETRKQKSTLSLYLSPTHTEIFDTTCNVVWNALNDTLKKSGKYDIIQTDDSDMMAIYSMGLKAEHRMDYAILKPKGNICSMQINQAPHGFKFGENDPKSLSHRIHAVLSK